MFSHTKILHIGYYFLVFFLKYFFQLVFIMLGFATWNASDIDIKERNYPFGPTSNIILVFDSCWLDNSPEKKDYYDSR